MGGGKTGVPGLPSLSPSEPPLQRQRCAMGCREAQIGQSAQTPCTRCGPASTFLSEGASRTFSPSLLFLLPPADASLHLHLPDAGRWAASPGSAAPEPGPHGGVPGGACSSFPGPRRGPHPSSEDVVRMRGSAVEPQSEWGLRGAKGRRLLGERFCASCRHTAPSQSSGWPQG